MSRRSQTLKKRHTKPCKFFQMNRCPHSAEICDFVHVLVSPVGAEASLSMCRYYYAGHCVNGASCKYRHDIPIASPLESRISPDSMHDWAAMSPSEAAYPDSRRLYGPYNSNVPYIQRWPSMPAYSPSTPFSPQSPESLLFSLSSRSRDSIQSLSTSNTSLDESSDDVVIVTDDPQYDEHPHSHQSQVCVAEDTPIVHVPPFHHAPVPLLYVNTQPPPLLGFDYAYGMGFKNTPHTKPRSNSSKSSLKQKALKYKTKPCKFFSTEKGCPNGSACTFIHDEKRSRSSSPDSGSQNSGTAEKEESPRKNFVPIPWRVIGGGVLVSTAKKDDADDQPSTDVDCPPVPLPSKPANIALPPLKIITRKRSNSIPSTPSITQVKVEHLFSAESPGVL